ncbi:MAG: PDDEXK nuclease domain-containing protein [Candidatus Nomurabacteria bacterium]|nr:PDDEXK nuclease domain-containing protein [Candidatus Nomurabacteria bacterium]
MKNNINDLFNDFLKSYDSETKDSLWLEQSSKFKDFWNNRVMSDSKEDLSDSEIDEIVKILDRNGKGNTFGCEAVAKAMVAQGAWRRMFNELKNKKHLGKCLDEIFKNSGDARANSINELYKVNEGNKNGLTGPSGNAVNAMIFAYNPSNNLSIISIKDRKKLLEYFKLENHTDFENDAIGEKIVKSNEDLVNGFKSLNIYGSPRTISTFLYTPAVKSLWKDEPENTFISSPEEQEEAIEIQIEEKQDNTDRTLFYMEKELENFLIKNWEKTELGKKYDLIDEDGKFSQQYPTGVGPIDILVKDKKDGTYVVLELKRNQTSDDTIGQLARYMGWLEENKTNGKPTRGIIITGAYDKRLYYASKKIVGCEIYIYQVDFKLKEFKE